jgi:hypothetical protein
MPDSLPLPGPGVVLSDCRSEEGITVGLIDALIAVCRVLAPRDLTTPMAREALRDLLADEDVRLVLGDPGPAEAAPHPTAC